MKNEEYRDKSLVGLSEEYKKYKNGEIVLKPYMKSMDDIATWLQSKGK